MWMVPTIWRVPTGLNVEGHQGTSLCPLGTEGWDGQVGQRIVLRDTMGTSLGIEGWDGHRVTLKDRLWDIP